jgi:hypothetical protein
MGKDYSRWQSGGSPELVNSVIVSCLQKQDAFLTASEVADAMERNHGIAISATFEGLEFGRAHGTFDYKDGKGYCARGRAAKLEAAAARRANNPHMSRVEFARLSPAERMEFCTKKGGVIV